jgi:isopenicillin N synthase-like dioxygenase
MKLPLVSVKDPTAIVDALSENQVLFLVDHGLEADSREMIKRTNQLLSSLTECPPLEERTMSPEKLKQLPDAKRRVVQRFVARESKAPITGAMRALSSELKYLASKIAEVSDAVIEAAVKKYALTPTMREGLLKRDEWVLNGVYYPFVKGAQGKVFFPAQKNWGTLAIYPAISGSGLEFSVDKEWGPVKIPKVGAMLCYAGDILQRVTNGGIKALAHRMIQPTNEGGHTALIFYADTWRDLVLPTGEKVNDLIESKLQKIGQIT